MKIIGNPERKKQKMKELVKNLTFDDKYLIHKKNFRKEILRNINKNTVLLDINLYEVNKTFIEIYEDCFFIFAAKILLSGIFRSLNPYLC